MISKSKVLYLDLCLERHVSAYTHAHFSVTLRKTFHSKYTNQLDDLDVDCTYVDCKIKICDAKLFLVSLAIDYWNYHLFIYLQLLLVYLSHKFKLSFNWPPRTPTGTESFRTKHLNSFIHFIRSQKRKIRRIEDKNTMARNSFSKPSHSIVKILIVSSDVISSETVN